MEEFCKLGILKTTETLKNCLKVWTSHSEKVVLTCPRKGWNSFTVAAVFYEQISEIVKK